MINRPNYLVPKAGTVPPAPTVEDTAKRDTAKFIADMSLEMHNMAKARNFLSLQGLLEVVYYEAYSIASGVVMPEDEIEHIRELSRASTR